MSIIIKNINNVSISSELKDILYICSHKSATPLYFELKFDIK